MYKGIIFCSSTLWMMFNGSSNSTDDLHCTDELARLILCPLIAGVALLGNVLAVLSIRVRDKFRIPTYAAISCLAVSDSLAVIFRLARALTCRICVLYYDTRACLSGKHTLYDKFGAIASIPSFISIHSSFCHLVLFSVIRYIIVVHPMFAHRYLTSGKVLRYSGLACNVRHQFRLRVLLCPILPRKRMVYQTIWIHRPCQRFLFVSYNPSASVSLARR